MIYFSLVIISGDICIFSLIGNFVFLSQTELGTSWIYSGQEIVSRYSLVDPHLVLI